MDRLQTGSKSDSFSAGDFPRKKTVWIINSDRATGLETIYNPNQNHQMGYYVSSPKKDTKNIIAFICTATYKQVL